VGGTAAAAAGSPDTGDLGAASAHTRKRRPAHGHSPPIGSPSAGSTGTHPPPHPGQVAAAAAGGDRGGGAAEFSGLGREEGGSRRVRQRSTPSPIEAAAAAAAGSYPAYPLSGTSPTQVTTTSPTGTTVGAAVSGGFSASAPGGHPVSIYPVAEGGEGGEYRGLPPLPPANAAVAGVAPPQAVAAAAALPPYGAAGGVGGGGRYSGPGRPPGGPSQSLVVPRKSSTAIAFDEIMQLLE
jgi:hypothetical protein